MKRLIYFKNLRVMTLVIGLALISCSSAFKMPVHALGPFLRLNVTPSSVSFNIVDAEKSEPYYSVSQKVTVVSRHSFPSLEMAWHLGIRSAEAYLKDSINPNNQIQIAQLHWSRDNRNFQQLSQQWALINSYFDLAEKPYEEEITYRLYPAPGQSLPAGLYSARIEFDARWHSLPWR